MRDFMIGDVDAVKMRAFAQSLRDAVGETDMDEEVDAARLSRALEAAVAACGEPAEAYMKLFAMDAVAGIVGSASLSHASDAPPMVRAAARLIHGLRIPGQIDRSEIDLAYATVVGDDVGHNPSP